jgi:uncharacterized protein (DUF2336 family)
MAEPSARAGDFNRQSPICGADELRALEQLAKENSSEKRRELMCRLSDFLTDESDIFSDETIVLLSDILVSLVDQLDEPGRAELSRRVAPSRATPHKLARTLAMDESVNVAVPILEKSPVLRDEDLVEIAGSNSEEHVLAITRREHISGCVTDAIIDNGTMKVLRSVAENAGAEITHSGFRRLVEEAPWAEGLMQALSQRTDVPKAVVKSAIAKMPQSHRERLQRLWSEDAPRADLLVDQAAQKMSEVRLNRRRGLLEAKVAAKEIENGDLTIEEAVLQFARDERLREVAHVLACATKLPEKFIHGAMLRLDGGAIGMICRSVDLGDDAFIAIANMRCSKLRLPSSQARHWLEIYRTINAEVARRALRFSIVRTALRQAGAA